MPLEKIVDYVSMSSVVMGSEEIVVYGAGNMGRAVVKNLIEHGWRDRIACCAVTCIHCNPREVLEVPVLELRQLPHYRETACFMIAAQEKYQKDIYENLVCFGCQNIKVVEYSYILELAREQHTVRNEIVTFEELEEKILTLTATVKELQYQITEQNEICATNQEAFKCFENCNYGREVVVVASGPTMTHYVPKAGAVHIGVNATWKRFDIPYDYFFIQDGNRKYDYRSELDNIFEHVNGTIFMGRYFKRCPFKEIELPVIADTKGKEVHYYWVETDNLKDLYQNICYHPVMDYGSIVFPALQFALYTYPAKIYLVGCDVSNEGDFDWKEHYIPQLEINKFKLGYAKIKEFAMQYYPETEIISVNPVGLKGLFAEEYTDNFLEGR